MTEEQQAAVTEFDKASKKLASTGSSKNSNGVEVAYNMAYKTLVRLGVKPRLRGRYNV